MKKLVVTKIMKIFYYFSISTKTTFFFFFFFFQWFVKYYKFKIYYGHPKHTRLKKKILNAAKKRQAENLCKLCIGSYENKFSRNAGEIL